MSYDELIALAALAKVKTLVLQASTDQLTCKGHNFDAVPGDSEDRIVIIALIGRIQFERLMDATDYLALTRATDMRSEMRDSLAYELHVEGR